MRKTSKLKFNMRCEQCRRWYEKIRPWQRFCSDKCRVEHWHDQHSWKKVYADRRKADADLKQVRTSVMDARKPKDSSV